MSVRVMALVFDAHFHDIEFQAERKKKTGETVTQSYKILAPTAKWITVALADHSNDQGEGAYPSLERLCDKTDLSMVTVVNGLKALKHIKLISYEGKSKYGTSNYTINLALLQAMKEQEKQVREKAPSKATLEQPLKPLYTASKATLDEPSLTVPKPFCAKPAQETPALKQRPPSAWGIGWQLAAGVDRVELPTSDEQTQAELANALNLFHEPEKPYILAFYQETGILPVQADVAYWRKAISYQRAKGVTPENLVIAAQQASKDGMTISSPKSLEKYAVDAHARAAKKPAQSPSTSNDFAKHLDNFVPRQ